MSHLIFFKKKQVNIDSKMISSLDAMHPGSIELFQICDMDNDGILNDREIYQFQVSTSN